MKETDQEKLLKLKTQAVDDYEITDDLRRQQDAEMRFRHQIGGMWEDWQTATHGDNTVRAKLEFDVVSEPINRFNGEWRLNRKIPVFSAKDSKTDEKDAELLNGVFRADFNDSSGVIALDNAVEEASECGFGAFLMTTKYEGEDDPENENQDICFEPIYGAYSNVLFGGNAKNVDKSDARRCTVLTQYTDDALKEEYPDMELTSSFDIQSYGRFSWREKDLTTIASRYDVKKEKKVMHVYENMETGQVNAYEESKIESIKDELKEDGFEFVRKRTITRQNLYKTIFSGNTIIEDEQLIPGGYVTIIPIYFSRKVIRGIEHVKGMIRPLMDPQRLFNTGISRVADAQAISPDTKMILDSRQIESDEARNSVFNPHDKAVLVVDPIDDVNGNPIPTNTSIGYTQQGQVDQNTIAAVEMTSNYVQRATGNAPQDQVDPDASGVAIQNLGKRENMSTQTASDNIKLAMKHCGSVWLSIFNDINTTVREKRSMGVDGKVSLVKLNHHVLDNETGEFVIGNDVSKGNFAVDVTTGGQYETQKQEAIASIERVLGVVKDIKPEYIDPLMGSWVNLLPDDNMEPLKKYNRKQMLIAGHIDPETDEEKQMLQQLGQQQTSQDKLAEAATNQQNAEAKSLEASSIQKIADSEKKRAETAKIVVDIQDARKERAMQIMERLGMRQGA